MDFEVARRHMVDSQILPNRVTDPDLIDAIAETPREVFLPENLRSLAYCDEALEVADGRHLMEPMIAGRLLQSVNADKSDVALLVGASTGYLATILSRIVDTVVVVEDNKDLAAKAEAAMEELGIDNVVIMDAPLNRGFPDQAPYDVIVFDGSVPTVPTSIAEQLGEGGRLIAVTGGGIGIPGRAMLTTRFRGALSTRHVFDAGTPVLPGFDLPSGFSF